MEGDFLRKNVDCLEHQQGALENMDSQIRKLERDLTPMKDAYHNIFSENRHLNALFTRQQKDTGAELAREEALTEAREKSRVEEEVRTPGGKREV